MARKPITKVDKDATVLAVFSDPGGDDCFVPGWDRYAGNQQGMVRAAQRRQMGKKMTPIGRGVSISRNR